MVLSGEMSARIRNVLEKHPEGISITDLVKSVDVNRNTAGRYLENMLLSGQVEMRRFGMAKMYTLTKRLPVSSVLSLSSELVIQLDNGQRVFYANDPLLTFLGAPAKDLFGKNIEFTPFSIIFEDVFTELHDRFRNGLRGEGWHGELSRPVRERFFFCRITPTVSNEGKKGVSVILEDISDRKRDEERIRKSEARLRSIFRVSPVGIGVVADRILLEVNDRFCEMTGYSPAEIVGGSARILYRSEETFRNVGTLYTRQIRESGNGTLETQWVKKDGTVIDVLLNTTPLDPSNISGGITFTVLDITARKRAEQALRESEEKYRHLVEQSLQGLTIIQNGRPVFANATMLEIGGFSQDEYLALSPEELMATVHPGDRDHIRKVMKARLEEKIFPAENEFRILRKDGQIRWVLTRGMRITYNRAPAIQVAYFDITARKLAEDALRESEDRYRKLVEISPNAVMLHRDGKVIYVNPALIRLLRAGSAGDLLGKNVLDLLQPSYRERIQANITKDLTGEPTPFMELQMLRADGTTVFVEGQGAGTTIDGMPAVLVAINDMTEHHHASLALKESEERYRTLAEASQDIIYLVGRDDRVEYVNSYAAAIRGLSADEVIGKKRSSLFSGELGLRQAQGLDRVFETGKTMRSEGAMEISGTLHWFDHQLMPIKDAQGVVTSVLGVSRDITDRKLADEQLLQREQQYRFIFDNSLDIINRQTPDCICTSVSPAITPLLGYLEEEVLGKSALAMVHPDDLDLIQRNMTAIVQNGLSHLTSTFRFRHKDGRYLWFESTIKVIRDEKTGQVLEFLSMSRDITARKSDG